MRLSIAFLAIFLALGTPAWPQDAQPSRVFRLTEKKLEEFAGDPPQAAGLKALEIHPEKWKHAETENFIMHYRSATEAQRVGREIEFDLWYVAKTLGATKDQYSKKSHVFIFKDEKEWKEFLKGSGFHDWATSFAHGDELFLHVGGMGEPFNSHVLAHETTHAVVARLYPQQHWPVWLNEGFAEYMGAASVAARKTQGIKSVERNLTKASLTLAQLTAMTDYPTETEEIHQLYQTSEKLVRFLMTEYPKDLLPKFVEAILGGATFETAITQTYAKQVKDYAEFEKKYARFTK